MLETALADRAVEMLDQRQSRPGEARLEAELGLRQLPEEALAPRRGAPQGLRRGVERLERLAGVDEPARLARP